MRTTLRFEDLEFKVSPGRIAEIRPAREPGWNAVPVKIGSIIRLDGTGMDDSDRNRNLLIVATLKGWLCPRFKVARLDGAPMVTTGKVSGCAVTVIQ